MSTENLTATTCEEKQTRKKTIAIVTDTLAKTFLAEILSHFTFLLANQGWDVAVVTNNRQNHTDFLIDERTKRYSLDMTYRVGAQRQSALLQFIQEHDDIDHYLLWNVNADKFCEDFDTIHETGKAVFIAFWDSMNAIADAGVGKKNRIMARAALSNGVISAFPLDQVLNSVVYIPFLHPYFPGDLRRAELGKKDLLLLTYGSSARVFAIVQNFVELLETDASFKDKTLRIVPIKKKLLEKDVAVLTEVAQQYPKNIFLEELCEKPHKILDGYAGAVFVDNGHEAPKMLSVAVAKGLPSLFVKGYADYSIQNFNKGFRICHSNNSEKLKEELKRFFDPKVNAKRAAATLRAIGEPVKNEIIRRWEDVLLGNPVEEYQFVTNEHVLMCCLSYMKNLNQKLHQRVGIAGKYNADPIVKRAKKRAARVRNPKKFSLIRICRSARKNWENLIKKFHIWERNKRFKFSFIEPNAETRRKLQLLIMKMYVEFERICKELDLRYYVAGGTLLGALRHKGFIPWDDDLDVSMPRKDYDKFLKYAPKMLAEQFHLNANAYPYAFSRLEILGTHMTAPLHRKGRRVFLDIIPLDCACPDQKKKEKQAKLNEKLILYMCEHARRIPQLYWKNRQVIFRRIWLKLFATHKGMNRRWTRNAKKYQSDNATHWVCLPGEYGYDGETFPKEYWGEPVMLEFEGLQVPGMQEYDLYLTAHYGDYMQPPPASQRGMKHNIYSLSLGKYEDMTVAEIAQELSDDYFASTGKRVNFMK